MERHDEYSLSFIHNSPVLALRISRLIRKDERGWLHELRRSRRCEPKERNRCPVDVSDKFRSRKTSGVVFVDMAAVVIAQRYPLDYSVEYV
jgi:hypothetical protein